MRQCAENPVRLKLTRECLIRMASEARGRGGPAREHGHWKHLWCYRPWSRKRKS